MEIKFIVTLDLDIPVKPVVAKAYVRDAIVSHGHAYHPNDPLFGLEDKNVFIAYTSDYEIPCPWCKDHPPISKCNHSPFKLMDKIAKLEEEVKNGQRATGLLRDLKVTLENL